MAITFCSKEIYGGEFSCTRKAIYQIPDKDNPKSEGGPRLRYRYGNGFRCTQHTPTQFRLPENKIVRAALSLATEGK